MKSKISDNKCHNIDTNNQNDKIPESAPSELRHTTTNKNNHKNISKNENDEKINENINNSMANNINFDSASENNKNNGNKNKGNCINSNEGNSNNNNNSSSKERNMSSSNINSKINIKNINDNSKENNMNSNGGDNSTNSKQKQASNNTNSISNNNNNGNSKENNISSSNINSKTRKTAFIIGDSMVKKIDGYLLTSSINYRYIVKVRPFLSAKTIDMVDYIKPTQRDFNSDVYLLHVGTNFLSSNKSPEQISLDILNLANSLKLDNNTVIVSSIVPRDDENKKKVDEVNTILEKLCKANSVGIISHRNINPKRHLNRSRLHLNNADVYIVLFFFNVNISYTPMTNNDLLEIQQQRVGNAKSIIVGHLNINSIRNKFIFAESIVKAFDLFLISESKLDSTFPMNQFHILGFKVFRLDRNRFGGGLILYINENIPCRPLSDHPTFPNLELIAIEIHQNKRRWLFIGMYKPPSQSDREFTYRLSSIIDYY